MIRRLFRKIAAPTTGKESQESRNIKLGSDDHEAASGKQRDICDEGLMGYHHIGQESSQHTCEPLRSINLPNLRAPNILHFANHRLESTTNDGARVSN